MPADKIGPSRGPRPDLIITGNPVLLLVSRSENGNIIIQAAGYDGGVGGAIPIHYWQAPCEGDPSSSYVLTGTGDNLASAFWNFCGAVGDEIIKTAPHPAAVALAAISKPKED